MPADLLFEIGCEEIPAKMLARQLAELPAAIEARLTAARLAHAGVRALGTPRRVAVIVKQLADRQPDLDEEVIGPPASAAFAADGTVSKAGLGFAAKNGVEPSALVKREVAGKKGLYVAAQRHVAGIATRALLPELLRELAAGLAWPKSQRWGWTETTFVRPVQWVVALLGGEVVPLEWAGHASGRKSRGHRFLSTGWIEIASAERYVETLHAAHVVVDQDERRKRVRDELARLERETGCKVRPDEALLDEVIHLGEWPVGVVGSFDPAFLEVPEEMIVTAMRTHQRYFAMETAAGKLAPRFATMMATVVKDPAVVARGNETVLAARLADAKFFFAEDKKHTFAEWNKKLDGVVFQAKLGAARFTGQKVARIVAVVSQLANEGATDRNTVVTAARLCKADLASLAVGEFPELQGVMGRHYAQHFGESKFVGDAIEQHYWPKGQGGALPSTREGAAIAVADRMDTVVGCFAVGLEPSGSADPFGLRRAAIGIWQILLERGEQDPTWDLWTVLFTEARTALAKDGVTLADDTALRDFFRTRLRGIFVEQGIPVQDADAALAKDFTQPVNARARALACGKISKEAREVFKRVANILDDARAKAIAIGQSPDPKLFVSDNTVEQNLYAAVVQAKEHESQAWLRSGPLDYVTIFESLEQIRPTVAAFFDKGGVMVMDKDPALRDNRLALLNWFISPYAAIADFRVLGAAT